MINKKKLTKKQLETMKIFWSSSNPLTASDIVERNPSLNINTVRATIKFLLDNNYIKADDVVLKNKSLTRTYSPTITADEYVVSTFSKSSKTLFSTAIVSNLVSQENDLTKIKELKAIIEQREQELKEKQ
ncbi:MAG: BlaI/MecI/CopY family transcriptional regulator [Anaerostipes sp.]|nr:BlaI/MecI/CopY family transcriptional regulator [Anaerostipes sp.]